MIALFIYILFTSFIISDDNPCESRGLVTINENFFNDDIIGFYLSSINIESGESNTLLFDYSIDLSQAILKEDCISSSNGGLGSIDSHGIELLYMNFNISMFIPDLMDQTKQLVSGRVKFKINSPTINEINFRNTDLNFDTQYLAGNTSFTLESYDLNVTDTQLEEIADLVLSQGRAPNGVYSFNFELESENGTQHDVETKSVEVFVPSFLDLVSPGSNEISDSTSNIIMTSNPIFQWNSDYCNKCDFSIRVSEYKSNTHSSLQEALDDYSILPLGSNFYNIPGTVNSFQFPSSGTGELSPGKIYVWQIMRSYMTSNGLNQEFSPVYMFKMQSMDISETSIVTADINFENIKLLIGDDLYNSLFGLNAPFNEFKNIDQTLSIDGENYSVNYLIDLINKKNSGEIIIMQVDVE